ncbi:Flagellar basal body protein [Rhodovastum atsumiense]|uniref:Flagellar hook basal-body protein n=1 Tax=Rhodovastum atsumiense TaxID=504468 RepID=A0A5M6IUA9_9PROT|nr:flagellar hook basal-body protein [Rhodovastum atsumiense]KAA5611128.1 flagellar hook basal-body protein [Rhodovastum atsumiense]CAH2599195.1 Flagellar basal body protein [Rhodovastum atsumiense]
MDNATNVALSRLVAQSRAMDVTATNLANAGTPGFRAERMAFSDWLSRQRGTPPGGNTVTYTQDRATYRERQAGTLTHTGNPLDLAISGDGFFTVSGPSGPRLTRAGHFMLAANGTLTDAGGNALLDTAGKKLQLAPADTHISVAADGTVTSENGVVGRIGIVSAADPNRLQAEGSRLLNGNDTSTTPVTAPHIVQGSVEDSNVQPVLEVSRMMSDVRTFQMVAQFVQSEAERQQGAIDKITQKRS